MDSLSGRDDDVSFTSLPVKFGTYSESQCGRGTYAADCDFVVKGSIDQLKTQAGGQGRIVD